MGDDKVEIDVQSADYTRFDYGARRSMTAEEKAAWDKTLQGQTVALQEAMAELFWGVVEAIHIPQLCDWLGRKFGR